MKALVTCLLLVVVGVCLLFGGEAVISDIRMFFDGTDAPLKEGQNEKIIYVRDGDGKPIPGARVTVDYDSMKHPPFFIADTNGCARVQVTSGFWGIRVEALEKRIIVRGDIEWPLLVVISGNK